MTSKQKKNIARFKEVQKEAKKLRLKNKKLTQAEAVKQAWAIQYSKEGKSIKGDQLDLFSAAPKKAAKKSRTKRPEGYQYGKSNLEKDQQRQAKAPGKRKSASGRTYYEYRSNRSDKGKLLGTHKDTKSHNVNIRVVSGLSKIIGVPHKAKYYIITKKQGVKHIEYFDKLPKDYYKGMSQTLYLMRLEDSGTVLTPIRHVKNDLPVKKS